MLPPVHDCDSGDETTPSTSQANPMSDLTRTITFIPASKSEPLLISFVLQGPRGAVAYEINSQWTQGIPCPHTPFPSASAITMHSRRRINDGSDYCESCSFLGGEPCYGDAFFADSRKLLLLFVSQGVDPVWEALEKWYDTFPTPLHPGPQGAD